MKARDKVKGLKRQYDTLASYTYEDYSKEFDKAKDDDARRKVNKKWDVCQLAMQNVNNDANRIIESDNANRRAMRNEQIRMSRQMGRAIPYAPRIPRSPK